MLVGQDFFKYSLLDCYVKAQFISDACPWKQSLGSWLQRQKQVTTVDGRNPAPADVVDIPVFIGFYTSQVVQDFFHQQ